MTLIKVLLVEDHTIVRKGIHSLLNGEAENGRDAVTKTEELLPDVVLMDLMMPISMVWRLCAKSRNGFLMSKSSS